MRIVQKDRKLLMVLTCNWKGWSWSQSGIDFNDTLTVIFLMLVKQNADVYLDRIFSDDHRKREIAKKELIQLGVHRSVHVAQRNRDKSHERRFGRGLPEWTLWWRHWNRKKDLAVPSARTMVVPLVRKTVRRVERVVITVAAVRNSACAELVRVCPLLLNTDPSHSSSVSVCRARSTLCLVDVFSNADRKSHALFHITLQFKCKRVITCCSELQRVSRCCGFLCNLKEGSVYRVKLEVESFVLREGTLIDARDRHPVGFIFSSSISRRNVFEVIE